MMKTLTALASLALIPMSAAGANITASHPGTATATTYTTDGSFHGAVDITGTAPCGSWGISTGFVGSLYWDVSILSTTATCSTPSQNSVVHTWADGWSFRILNFLRSSSSYDRTCDRCEIGTQGHHTHYSREKSGTKDTSWYAGYTTLGEAIDAGEVIGVL